MSMLAQLAKIPAPLFGSAATAFAYGRATARKLPAMAPWAFPAIVGGMWFVWPAVDEEWKQSIGFGKKAPVVTPAAAPKEPELDASALAKVQAAYKADAVDEDDEEDEDSEDENLTLEEIWDRDLYDPGDVDDDDDEDDDEEDDEEEEEEEEGEEEGEEEEDEE